MQHNAECISFKRRLAEQASWRLPRAFLRRVQPGGYVYTIFFAVLKGPLRAEVERRLSDAVRLYTNNKWWVVSR